MTKSKTWYEFRNRKKIWTNKQIWHESTLFFWP